VVLGFCGRAGCWQLAVGTKEGDGESEGEDERLQHQRDRSLGVQSRWPSDPTAWPALSCQTAEADAQPAMPCYCAYQTLQATGQTGGQSGQEDVMAWKWEQEPLLSSSSR
jgi:hypothetical protein